MDKELSISNSTENSSTSFTNNDFYKKNKFFIWALVIIFIFVIINYIYSSRRIKVIKRKLVKPRSKKSYLSLDSQSSTSSTNSTNTMESFNLNKEDFEIKKPNTSQKHSVKQLIEIINKELNKNIKDEKSINNTINIVDKSEINQKKIIDELKIKKEIIILHNDYIKEFKNLKNYKSESLKDLVKSLSKKDLSLNDVNEFIKKLKTTTDTEFNTFVKNEISKSKILNILNNKYKLLKYYGIKHNIFRSNMYNLKKLSNMSNSSNNSSNNNSSKNNSSKDNSSKDKSSKDNSNRIFYLNTNKINKIKVTKLIQLINKELKYNIRNEKSITNTINLIEKSQLDKNIIINELKIKQKIIILHNNYIKELNKLKKLKSPFFKDLIKSLSKKDLSLKNIEDYIINLNNTSDTEFNKVVKNEILKKKIVDILKCKHKLLKYYGIKHNRFGLKRSNRSRSFRYYDRINNIDLIVDGLSLKCSIERK